MSIALPQCLPYSVMPMPQLGLPACGHSCTIPATMDYLPLGRRGMPCLWYLDSWRACLIMPQPSQVPCIPIPSTCTYPHLPNPLPLPSCWSMDDFLPAMVSSPLGWRRREEFQTFFCLPPSSACPPSHPSFSTIPCCVPTTLPSPSQTFLYGPTLVIMPVAPPQFLPPYHTSLYHAACLWDCYHYLPHTAPPVVPLPAWRTHAYSIIALPYPGDSCRCACLPWCA